MINGWPLHINVYLFLILTFIKRLQNQDIYLKTTTLKIISNNNNTK